MAFTLEIWGERACFSRPELKVERVSYDIITPSAARGIFEAILWKPAISWHIDQIRVCKHIRFENIRRNEVNSKAGSAPYIAASEDRAQRAAIVLKDVRYTVTAHFEMTDQRGESDTEAKFAAMFDRRAKTGQCYHQPYLGTREFPASFRLIPAGEALPPAIDETRSLGLMLFDVECEDKWTQVPSDSDDPKQSHWSCERVGDFKPTYFRAEMEKGVVNLRHVEVFR